MGIAFLLLGLLPLMFLPDLLDNGGDGEQADYDLPPSPLPIGGDPQDDAISLLDDPDRNTDAGDTDAALAPVNQDDPPDDGSQNPDPQDILLPVDEDDVATLPDGDAGNLLLPVDQISSEANTIWINFDDDAGLGYSEIEDFQAGLDVLHVLIDPDSVIGELDVEVRTAEDGLDALVFVEQQLVAILKGAPEATVADVIVEFGAIAV